MPRHNCPGYNGASERVSGGQRCLALDVRGGTFCGGDNHPYDTGRLTWIL